VNVTRLVPFVFVTFVSTAAAAGAGGQDQSQHAMPMLGTNSGLVEHVREISQDFRRTPPPGYDEFPGCVSGPQQGAMGVHFVDGSAVDGTLDVSHPEAFVYERRNGGLRLVAVEYIVPLAAWQEPHPPVLEGQLFQFIDAPNRFGLPPFYELHVWAWRENPDGAFVDWNTLVSCERQ
jgi:hypothetical protein